MEEEKDLFDEIENLEDECESKEYEGTIKENGFGTISQYVMRNKNLSSDAKCLYAYLMSFAGNKKTAFPKRNTILAELKWGKNKIGKHLNELKAEGLITVRQERKPVLEDGTKKTIYGKNIYTFIFRKDEVIAAKLEYLKKLSTKNGGKPQNPQNEDTDNSQNPQNEDTEKNGENTSGQHPYFEDTENQDTENQDTENRDTNNINISSLNTNSNINTNTPKGEGIETEKPNSTPSLSFRELWEKTLSIVKNELTEVSFNTWIGSLKPIKYGNNKLIISAPNNFTKEIAETRYIDLIKNAFKAVTNNMIEIKVEAERE